MIKDARIYEVDGVELRHTLKAHQNDFKQLSVSNERHRGAMSNPIRRRQASMTLGDLMLVLIAHDGTSVIVRVLESQF